MDNLVPDQVLQRLSDFVHWEPGADCATCTEQVSHLRCSLRYRDTLNVEYDYIEVLLANTKIYAFATYSITFVNRSRTTAPRNGGGRRRSITLIKIEVLCEHLLSTVLERLVILAPPPSLVQGSTDSPAR